MSKRNYVDFSQAYKAIGKTKQQFEKAEVESLTKAGEYAADKLSKNTPYWDSKNYAKKHAKNHVVFSKPTKRNPKVEVGYDKEVAWRVHFVEYGTIKQRPQPFMQQTMKEIENQVATSIQNEMMRRLNQ